MISLVSNGISWDELKLDIHDESGGLFFLVTSRWKKVTSEKSEFTRCLIAGILLENPDTIPIKSH